MSLTALFTGGLFCILFTAVYIGMMLAFKKKDVFNRPGVGVSLAILLQVIILVLFFTGILGEVSVALFRALWWGTVLLGFVFGIIDIKKNVIAALLAIFMSCILAVFGLLMFLIASM